jgi:hypothetical protein
LIRRKTQDPAFWAEEYTVTSDEIQHISNRLIEEELPRSAEELSRALVLQRCRQEEALIERALAQGTPYQPKRSYEVGEPVVFPAENYQVGEVVGMRAGHNPEYGDFQVIQVQFEDDGQREFAAELTIDHPLNRELNPNISEENLLSPDQLAELYAPRVAKKLEDHLESDPNFIRLANKWFRKDLLVEVHIGHLNLAEAVLDVNGGGPLPTEELLNDLELAEEISKQLRIFSLNYALQEDERFDEVGPTGEVLWFLRRLQPEKVKNPPHHLRYEPIEYNHDLLTSEMLALEQQLDDEWSDLTPPEQVEDPLTVILTHPHWKAGTLPLSSKTSQIFPTGRTHRIRFTFVDGETGEEMPGWVVREARYVYGLENWYRENGILVGAYLDLSPSEEPGKVVIQQRSRRPRREWVRIALPSEGQLTFEMRATLISCEYDELMVITEEDHAAVEAVWRRVHEEGISLKQLLSGIFPELTKLSPQGTVHAATLYSAANLALRTPPGPLLAELVTGEKYAPVGDNYWVLRASSQWR